MKTGIVILSEAKELEKCRAYLSARGPRLLATMKKAIGLAGGTRRPRQPKNAKQCRQSPRHGVPRGRKPRATGQRASEA